MKNRLIFTVCIILVLVLLFNATDFFALFVNAEENSEENLYIEVAPVIPAVLFFSEEQPSYDWLYTEIEFNALPLFNLTGKGVRVGVIDSGITEHPDLPKEKIVAAKSFVADDENTNDGMGGGGHGTSVAALIAGQGEIGRGAKGIAPDVEIVNARVLDSLGGMKMSLLPDAIDYCIEQGCDVINMSLGTTQPNITDYKKYIDLINCHNAIQRAISKGCIVIASAGNSGNTSNTPDFLVYPAALPDVIGVGSIKPNSVHHSLSQENKSVFVTAPGFRVFAATNSKNSPYALASGTSFSAPIVAGIAALIKEAYPDATQEQVKNFLKNTVTDCGDEGYDLSFGYGVVNGKNLAKALRNSDFYAYYDKDGKAFAANIGDDKQVLSYVATYLGDRNTGITDSSFSLDSMKRTELEMPDCGNAKRFFWLHDSFTPLCGSLTYMSEN